MKLSLFFIILLLSITIVSAEVNIGEENTVGRGVNIVPPEVTSITFNNNTGFVNSSNFWITNVGSLSDVNTTQFNNNQGVLNIIQSWVQSFFKNPFDQDLNTTDDVNFSSVTISDRLYLDIAKDDWIKMNASELFNGRDLAGDTFWLHHNESKEGGEIVMLFTVKNNTVLFGQSGINNSAGYLGNSWMIMPNNLSNAFIEDGRINLSKLSNCFIVADAIGEILRVDCGTTDTGADLFVQDDIQLGGKLFIGDGIRSEGDVEFFMNGFDFDIFNGSLHVRTPRLETIGREVGDNTTFFDNDFNDGTLQNFVQITSTPVATREWTVVSSVNCLDDQCARAQGGNAATDRIMEANISTENFNLMVLNFTTTTINIEPGDLLSVTVNNNEGSGDVQIFAIESVTAIQNESISLPSSMDNRSVVSLRYIFSATTQIEEAYVDEITITGFSNASTTVDIIRLDTSILLGDGSQRIFWNDSTKTLELPANVSFINVVEINLTITDSITLDGITINNWNQTAINIFDQVLNTTSNVSFGNVSSSSWFNGLFNWIINTGNVSTAYLTFNGSTLFFNEAQLNATIDDRATGGGATSWLFAPDLIYNDTSTVRVGIANVTPVIYTLQVDGNVSLNNTLFVNTNGEVTIDTILNTKEINIGDESNFQDFVSGVHGNGLLIRPPDITTRTQVVFSPNGAPTFTRSRMFFMMEDAGTDLTGDLRWLEFAARIDSPARFQILSVKQGVLPQLPLILGILGGAGNLNFAIDGNVGIGTSSPTHRLNVIGDGNFTADLFVGDDLFVVDTVGIGTFTPNAPLQVINFIDFSTNLAYGEGALSNLDVSSFQNVGIGKNAGKGVGGSASVQNVFIGEEAGTVIDGGDANMLIGFRSGRALTTGGSNVGIGGSSLLKLTTRNRNMAIGAFTMSELISGDDNVAIGDHAGFGGAPGTFADNIFIGSFSGQAIETGFGNVIIGFEAGMSNLVDGDKNVFIGHKAGKLFGDTSDKLIISNDETNASILIFGDFANDLVGINTINPTHTLNVVGNVNFTGGMNLSSYLSCTALETDANGNLLCGSDSGGVTSWLFASNLIYNDTSTLRFGVANVTPVIWTMQVDGNVSLNQSLFVNTNGLVGIGTANPDELLEVTGNIKAVGTIGTFTQNKFLGSGDTAFVITSNVVVLTGFGATNTIATITGGQSGQLLTIIFVDGLVTLTDDNGHSANTLDLTGDITGADDAVIQLIFDGVSWYQVSAVSTN